MTDRTDTMGSNSWRRFFLDYSQMEFDKHSGLIYESDDICDENSNSKSNILDSLDSNHYD